MLVLSRYVGERIIIGEGPGKITIAVGEIRGEKVKLAIEAPRHIVIVREELIPKPKPPEKVHECP